jgi:hypothetical protein
MVTMKISLPSSILIVAVLAFAISTARAGVPPLVIVPDYLSPDVKQKLEVQRDELEKRIAALRRQADDFNSKYGGRTFSEDDPQANTGLEEKAKLDKAGQDYSRDAQAFDDRVSQITDSMVVDARNVSTGLPKSVDDSIPHSPSGDRVRKGFQAVADPYWKRHDWKVALAWFRDALNHEPGNPAIKRLVDFAQYMVNRRTAEHTLAFENNSTPTQATPSTVGGDQMNPELKADMDEFFKVVIEPRLKAGEDTLLIQSEITPPLKASGHSGKPDGSRWSKFIKWMNDNFGPKKTKEPYGVGAVRD